MTDTPIQACATRHFNAPAEQVFDAFLDPETAGRFMFATPTGQMVRVEIDARVGGRFVFTDRREAGDAEHVGQYLEIDRPRRLVFQFSATGCDADFTRVALDIEPQSKGCALHLTHDMAPAWADYKERTEQGWRAMLEGLAATLSACI